MSEHESGQPQQRLNMRLLRAGAIPRRSQVPAIDRKSDRGRLAGDLDGVIAAALECGQLVVGFSLALRLLPLARWGRSDGPSQEGLAAAVKDRLAGIDERIVTVAGHVDRVTGFIHDFDRRSEADRIASEILMAMSRPFYVEGGTYYFASRLGLALLDANTGRGPQMMQAAGLALVDTDDLAPFSWYNARMGARHQREAAIIEALGETLAGPGPDVVYDVTIDRSQRQVVGIEALVRWVHPVLGEIERPELLRLAERSGLITELGRSVFTKAMTVAATLTRRGLLEGVTLWVNFAPVELLAPDFRSMIRSERERHPNVAFGIEIGEGPAIAEKVVCDTIRSLAHDDVRAAVDDFGGDFSALSRLTRLPFDTIKLSHDLTRFVETSSDDRRIVQLIIELANRHDLVLMATGIETEGQLEAIDQLGIQLVQGHHLSGSLTADQLAALLEATIRAPAQ